MHVDFVSVFFAPLCENVTSVTKPEVHNMLGCRQRRIEPRQQKDVEKILMKLAHVVFSERELTFTFAICYRPSVCRLSVCRL